MELNKTIAKPTYERYFFIRVNLGYSDSEVARAAGISRATLSNWKVGRGFPKVETLYKIAQVLGCNVTDIIGGPDEETSNRACNG